MNQMELTRSFSGDLNPAKRPRREAGSVSRLAVEAEQRMKEIVTELIGNVHSDPFREPVTDDVAPGYSEVVTNPMDLGTVMTKLKAGAYRIGGPNQEIGAPSGLTLFCNDMRLIFSNCREYNPVGNWVRAWGDELAGLFERILSSKISPLQMQSGGNELDYPPAPILPKGNSKSKKRQRPPSLPDPLSQDAVYSQPRQKPSTPRRVDSTVTMSIAAAALAAVAQSALPPAEAPPRRQRIKPSIPVAEPSGPLVDVDENIRMKCLRTAQILFRKTVLPLAAGPFTITCLGAVTSRQCFHDNNYLYPIGYRCSYAKLISTEVSEVAGENTVSHKKKPTNHLVPLTRPPAVVLQYDCTILDGGASGPSFKVTAGGVNLSQRLAADAAWATAEAATGLIVRRIQWRLRRCKSLLNRLCCHPDVMPFLEEVDPRDVPAYHSVIRRPLSMRALDQKLKAGSYVNEFAFAMDVRLLFSNAQRFNPEGSALYIAATNISNDFESLFASWVLSPNDSGGLGTNAPMGPWHDWAALRYFDHVLGCAKCRRNRRLGDNTPAPEEDAMLPQCDWCADRWHMKCIASVGGAAVAAAVATSGFVCPRCSEAFPSALNTAIAMPYPTVATTQFANPPKKSSKKKKGGSSIDTNDEVIMVWRPATPEDMPLGYMVGFAVEEPLHNHLSQLQLTHPAGSGGAHAPPKQFLSPTGLLVTGASTAGALARMINERLNADAQMEGAGRRPVAKGVKSGKNLGSASSSSSMQGGSSYYFVAAGWGPGGTSGPGGNVDGAGSDGGESNTFGGGVSFGLSRPEVRTRLEGLPGVEACHSYGFQESARTLLSGGSTGLKPGEEDVEELRHTLDLVLAEERGMWRTHRQRISEGRLPPLTTVLDDKPTDENIALEPKEDPPETSTGPFLCVPPPCLGAPEPLINQLSEKVVLVEKLMSAWDFLASIRNLLGYVPPPFNRVIRGTILGGFSSIPAAGLNIKPTDADAALPRPDALLFEEACTLLTKVLLLETRHLNAAAAIAAGGGEVAALAAASLSAKPLSDILAPKVVNMLTWPEHAATCLSVLAAQQCHPTLIPKCDVIRMMTVAPQGWLSRCADVACLLLTHTMVKPFMRPVDANTIVGYTAVISSPMDFTIIRLRLWGGKGSGQHRYRHHSEFARDVRLIFTNAKTFNRRDTDYWRSADCMSYVFEQLYSKWILEPEKLAEESSAARPYRRNLPPPVPLTPRTSSASMIPHNDFKTEEGGPVYEHSKVNTDLGNGNSEGVKTERVLSQVLDKGQGDVAEACENGVKTEKISSMKNSDSMNALVEGAKEEAQSNGDVENSLYGITAVIESSESDGSSSDEEDDMSDVGDGDDVDEEQSASERRSSKLRRKASAISLSEPEPEPASSHPAVQGVRILRRGTGPGMAMAKTEGLWDETKLHPAFFGRLRRSALEGGKLCGSGATLALEKTLFNLRTRNSWEWTPVERVNILSALTEEAAQTAVVRLHLDEKAVTMSGGIPLSSCEGPAMNAPLPIPQRSLVCDEGVANACTFPPLNVVPLTASELECKVRGDPTCCLCLGKEQCGADPETFESWAEIPDELLLHPLNALDEGGGGGVGRGDVPPIEWVERCRFGVKSAHEKRLKAGAQGDQEEEIKAVEEGTFHSEKVEEGANGGVGVLENNDRSDDESDGFLCDPMDDEDEPQEGEGGGGKDMMPVDNHGNDLLSQAGAEGLKEEVKEQFTSETQDMCIVDPEPLPIEGEATDAACECLPPDATNSSDNGAEVVITPPPPLVAHDTCLQMVWKSRHLALREERRLRRFNLTEIQKPAALIEYTNSINNMNGSNSSGNGSIVSNGPNGAISHAMGDTNGGSHVEQSGLSGETLEADDIGEDLTADQVKALRADLLLRGSIRTQPLGEDRHGNQYWKVPGDDQQVAVRCRGVWWGVFNGPRALQNLSACCDLSLPSERHLRVEISRRTDLWGVRDKLEQWEKRKKEEALLRATPQTPQGRFSDPYGVLSSEEPLPGRLVETDGWTKVLIRRIRWLEDHGRVWRTIPVPPTGPIAVTAQQLAAARDLEGRLGEYLSWYDASQHSLMETLYASGDLERLNHEKTKTLQDWIDEGTDWHPDKGWLRFDVFATIRELLAETSALKILFGLDRKPSRGEPSMPGTELTFGMEEDSDMTAEERFEIGLEPRTYFDPSTTVTAVPSAILRLKIEMLAVSLCIPENYIGRHQELTFTEMDCGVEQATTWLGINLEEWRAQVMQTESAQDLMDLLDTLESYIPPKEGWLFNWYTNSPYISRDSVASNTVAAASARLYALDRALQWDRVIRAHLGDRRGLPRHLPRHYSFCLQCPLTPLCTLKLHHKGSCLPSNNQFSKVGHPLGPPGAPQAARRQTSAVTAPKQVPVPLPQYPHQQQNGTLVPPQLNQHPIPVPQYANPQTYTLQQPVVHLQHGVVDTSIPLQQHQPQLQPQPVNFIVPGAHLLPSISEQQQQMYAIQNPHHNGNGNGDSGNPPAYNMQPMLQHQLPTAPDTHIQSGLPTTQSGVVPPPHVGFQPPSLQTLLLAQARPLQIPTSLTHTVGSAVNVNPGVGQPIQAQGPLHIPTSLTTTSSQNPGIIQPMHPQGAFHIPTSLTHTAVSAVNANPGLGQPIQPQGAFHIPTSLVTAGSTVNVNPGVGQPSWQPQVGHPGAMNGLQTGETSNVTPFVSHQPIGLTTAGSALNANPSLGQALQPQVGHPGVMNGSTLAPEGVTLLSHQQHVPVLHTADVLMPVPLSNTVQHIPTQIQQPDISMVPPSNNVQQHIPIHIQHPDTSSV